MPLKLTRHSSFASRFSLVALNTRSSSIYNFNFNPLQYFNNMKSMSFESDCNLTLSEFSNKPSSPLPSPVHLRRASIPINNLEIDPRTLRNKDILIPKALEVVKSLIPSWSVVDVKDVRLSHISGALTNSVYTIENCHEEFPVTPKKILLRVYGIGVDQFVDRNKEIEWLAKLSSFKIGAKLLGIFHNGRLEQFLDSDTLTHEDIIRPDVSAHIAKRMSDLHSITKTFPAPAGAIPDLWSCIYKWLPIAKKEFPKLQHLMNSECFPVDFKEIEDKLPKLRSALKDTSLVFCHNDAQYGNILRLKASQELVVVDFEYSGYNPREYDIANHFCEWMANYHTDSPHRLNKNDYPSYSQQFIFIRSYLEAQFGSCDEAQINELYEEIQKYSLASNLKWGLWGIIQASTSVIEFDYLAYGTQRLHMFINDFERQV